MKYVKLIFTCFFLNFSLIYSVLAKEVKPQVLVYGDNIESFAAALQSARSGVATLWVIPTADYCSGCFSAENLKLINDTAVGGIWTMILKEVYLQPNEKDSTTNTRYFSLNSQGVLNAMHSLVAKEKNLSVVYNLKVKRVVNNVKDVEVEFVNKKKIKVNAAVDISEDLPFLLTTDIGLSLRKKEDSYLLEGKFNDLSTNILRTLVALDYNNNEPYGYTFQSLLNGSVGNIFLSKVNRIDVSNSDGFVYRLNKAQAIGASAAYCAFFKTTADKIDVRKLQTELMSFGSRLLPFVDVSIADPNFNSLQKFFLTEILPWDKTRIPLNFNGSDSVSVESVRSVLQQYYSRAQLWFVDNKTEYFTTKDFIELLKVVSFRGNDLETEIQKGWNKRFKFQGEFSLLHTITRYEFAVLMDAYANPFAKRVTSDGVILR